MNPERIYVFPPFKRLIKEKAAQSGKSIIQYTKELMKSQDPLDLLVKKRTNEKKFFDFP